MSPAYSVERTGANVLTLRHNDVVQGWTQSYLLMADVHWDNPYCDRALLKRHLDIAKARNAGIMVFGDFYCAMQGKYDKRSDKSALRPEHQGTNYLDLLVDTAADYLAPYASNIVMLGDGNHECYDGETEVLTSEGWKLFRRLNRSELIATLNLSTNCVEWQKPSSYHESHYTGKMHGIKSRGANFVVTPNHRIVHRPQKSDIYEIKRSEEFSYSAGALLTIPVSARSGNVDYSFVTDDELRLLGWLLTDGSIRRYDGKPTPRVQLYQRPAKIRLITDILDALGYEYAMATRERVTEHIQGKQLKEKNSTQHTITLRGQGKQRMLQLLDSKREVPEWMHRLSDRQFEIFLQSFIDGDGSRHKSALSSWMAYGEKTTLEKLQALCVTHGFKASLATYRQCQYRLNITRHYTYDIAYVGQHFAEIDYDAPVYCLTVPNGTMFVRRNGYVCVSGNTAIRNHLETDLLQRLCAKIDTQHMGYSGFVRFMFEAASGGNRSSRRMYWHHGYGGGGPVTKGVIGTNRRAAYVDADIYASGHIHESTIVENSVLRLSDSGIEQIITQLHIQLPTYKQEFDLRGGFHVEKGRPPKPTGAWLLEFYYRAGMPSDVHYRIERMD
jgi:hypothetical protein